MKVTSYAKVNNGILHIVTPCVMYNVPLHSIQTVTVENGSVCIDYIDDYLNGKGHATIQLDESFYPIITEAICNAPNTTSNVNNNITVTAVSREF